MSRNVGSRVNKDELQQTMKEHGVFVLLATRKIKTEHVLEHYYVRQDVEQVFDISKNYASLLPLNVEKEETRTALPKGRYNKAQCVNTGLVGFARKWSMAKLILASWETLPQVSIIWTGDINLDGLTLALILALWIVRKKL